MQLVKDKYAVRMSENIVETGETADKWKWYHMLPLAAAAIYIFTPILIWQFNLPSVLRFAGDALVILMIALAIGRMIRIDHIPGAFLVILALTIIGAIVAAFEGQPGGVTVYGWWMMFRFPIVGLYVYMVPDWPKSIPELLPKFLVILLGFQVLIQIILYLSGIRDFDNLAGTFGQKGVGPFVFFIILVLSFALGRWLAFGDWKTLAVVLVLGSFASALGEMKLFLIAAPLLALVTLGIYLMRGAKPRRVFIYVTFFAVAAASFLYAYDRFIVQGLGKAPLEVYLESENRDRYLDYTRTYGNSYQLGRINELEYGWQLIQRDMTTFIFGHGLGTRQYSPELGLVGSGVQESLYGFYVGRSLMVLTYEMGMLGFAIILAFMIITIVLLYRASKYDPDPHMNVIRIGVIIFTLFWPLWLWYKAVWIMQSAMILYWMIWGYAMHYSIGHEFRHLTVTPVSLEEPKASMSQTPSV